MIKQFLLNLVILLTLVSPVLAAGTYTDFVRLNKGPIDAAVATAMASASTVEIGYANGNTIHITGTATITSFGAARQAGVERTLVFDDVLTLTHSSSLILPGSANITTVAGDVITIVADTPVLWRLFSHTRGDGSIIVSRLGFDISAGEPASPTPGVMWWNSDEEVPDVKLNGATGQMFLEMYFHAKNNTASLIPNGTSVMGAGVINPDTILMAPMDGTDSANAKWFLGLATHDFVVGTEGKVTNFGKVRDWDTTGALSFGSLETWNAGDVLYVDPVNVGYLTNVEPEPPNVYMPVALILKVHATEGVVHVRATSIDETYIRTTRMALQHSDSSPERNALQHIHGDLDPIATAQNPNAGVITFTADTAYGQGKMVVVSNGVAETGVITIQGTSIDQSTGETTALDTEVITIDTTTADSNHLDGNSVQVWDLVDAYITTKWWQGIADITITQDSGSLTDLDVYQIAYNQFGEARSVRLRILDMTLQALGTDGDLSGHAYVVDVTGQKVDIQQIPDTELDIDGGTTPFVTDKWYQYRRDNFDIYLDGREDGFFFGMAFLGSPAKFANVNLSIWADIIP